MSKINVVYPPSTGIDITEIVPVARANMNIEQGDRFNGNVNVSYPPQTIIDATQRVQVDKAYSNIELGIGTFNSKVNVSYPPHTNIQTDRANFNIEQGPGGLSSKVNVVNPPQTVLRTDRANFNIEQGTGGLSSKVNVVNPPQTALRTDRANFNFERGIDGLKSPVNVAYPPQTSIQTDHALFNIEQGIEGHRSKVNVTYPPQATLGTDHANLYLERGIDDLKSPVNIVYPPYVEFKSTDKVARANFKYEPNCKSQANINNPPQINDGKFTDDYRVNVDIHTRNIVEEGADLSVHHLNESCMGQDGSQLITARVNTVKSFNLAHERSSPETVQFSKYLPPENTVTCEAFCKVSTNELTSTQVTSQQIRTLNAPTITQDKFSMQETIEMVRYNNQ